MTKQCKLDKLTLSKRKQIMKTKTLGQRIRELREQKDLSLREFATKILHVSPAFLSDIELGRRNPSEKNLKVIAQNLGISLEELQSYDIRLPLENLKRLAASDPGYGLLFRTVVDKGIKSKDLLDFLKKHKRK